VASSAASSAATAAGLTGRTAAARRGRSGKPQPPTEEVLHRRREIVALILLGLTFFLTLAFASSYGERNLCGRTGEWLARWALGSFGWAAWLMVGCLGLWGGTLFARVQPDSFTVRVSGLLLCVVALSGLLTHVFSSVQGNFPPGGIVGEFIIQQLEINAGLGNVGTLIVLLVLTLITFVLATDIAYYTSIVAGVGWIRGTRLGRMAASVRGGSAVAEDEEEDEDEYESEEEEDEPPARRARAAGGARGALGRLSRAVRGKQADDAPPDDAALAPFKVLEDDVPEASIPLPVGGEPRGASKAAAKPAAKAGAKAAAKAAATPAAKKAAAKQAAEEEEQAKQAASAAAKAEKRAPPPVRSRIDEEAEEEDEDEYEDEDGEEYEDDEEEDGDEEYEDEDEEEDDEEEDVPARGAKGKQPVVNRSQDDSPNQLTLYGEPATPTPVAKSPGPYVFPTADLLDDQESVDQKELDALLANKTEVLEKTLASFKIEARVVEIQKGPVISMFEMALAPGIKVERVRNLEDDLAIALRARTVRIVAPIPGKNTIGIEVPNPLRETVRLRPLLRCKEFTESKYALPIFLGRDASGRPMIVDLAKMPHLLVAGATGSGKSVCLNSILVSLLYTRTPEQVKLILIDPKMVELSQFGNAPHLATPVISDMKRAPAILDWAISKMEERYKLLKEAGVRNIYSYNKLGKEALRGHFGDRVDDPEFPAFLPFIVIVIDELADLMLTAAKEVETSITRVAAKSRAVGIHLIVATQRPSTNVITGLIKANLPTRIGFMVSSKIDSRVILDENGAEQLLGEGDMLVMSPAVTGLVRGQGTYLSEEEVHRVMAMVKSESGPAYEPELMQRKTSSQRDPDEEDELYDAAARFIFSTERGSASLLQRKFAIGYTRASRLIDMMAEEGVLGEYKGSQARELTMTLDEWIALKPEIREPEEDEAGA
jgi:S-DNA-T family DNA segregation ATPase FtsK/SpoIIIE